EQRAFVIGIPAGDLVLAYVVVPALEQGDLGFAVEVCGEVLCHGGQIVAENLALQRQGRGGDDGALPRGNRLQQRGHEVGQRLARAVAGLQELVGAVVESLGAGAGRLVPTLAARAARGRHDGVRGRSDPVGATGRAGRARRSCRVHRLRRACRGALFLLLGHSTTLPARCGVLGPLWTARTTPARRSASCLRPVWLTTCGQPARRRSAARASSTRATRRVPSAKCSVAMISPVVWARLTRSPRS